VPQNVAAEGITNPPIDELLTRQINAYYSQLGEGLLDHVGPLVETAPQEKPLSIALRELNEGKLVAIDIDPDAEPETTAPADPFASA
jgi:DNA-directed RNA polymerase subunit omega